MLSGRGGGDGESLSAFGEDCTHLHVERAGPHPLRSAG
jgi:hypothetical protein